MADKEETVWPSCAAEVPEHAFTHPDSGQTPSSVVSVTEMTHHNGTVGRNTRARRPLGDSPGPWGNPRPEIRKVWSVVTWHVRGRGKTGTHCDPRQPPLLVGDRHRSLRNLLRSKHLHVAGRMTQCYRIQGHVRL